MDELIFLIILVVLAAIGIPLAAIVVMVDTRKKMAGMQAQIDRIGVGLHNLDTAASTSTPNIETVETPLPKSHVEQEIDKSAGETIKESEEIAPNSGVCQLNDGRQPNTREHRQSSESAAAGAPRCSTWQESSRSF